MKSITNDTVFTTQHSDDYVQINRFRFHCYWKKETNGNEEEEEEWTIVL